MRRHIQEFVEECAGALELPDPIYEFGALQTPVDWSIAGTSSWLRFVRESRSRP